MIDDADDIEYALKLKETVFNWFAQQWIKHKRDHVKMSDCKENFKTIHPKYLSLIYDKLLEEKKLSILDDGNAVSSRVVTYVVNKEEAENVERVISPVKKKKNTTNNKKEREKLKPEGEKTSSVPKKKRKKEKVLVPPTVQESVAVHVHDENRRDSNTAATTEAAEEEEDSDSVDSDRSNDSDSDDSSSVEDQHRRHQHHQGSLVQSNFLLTSAPSPIAVVSKDAPSYEEGCQVTKVLTLSFGTNDELSLHDFKEKVTKVTGLPENKIIQILKNLEKENKVMMDEETIYQI